MDQLHQEKKREDIFVDPVRKDAFLNEHAKTLEEQKQRFEEAKRLKKQRKAGAPAGVNNDQNAVILADANERVEGHMPERYSVHVAQQEQVGQMAQQEHAGQAEQQNAPQAAEQQRTPLPAEMTALLDEVLTWTRVKAETSIPVKEAAEKLRDASNDNEAAEAMSSLALSCVNYMDINGNKTFKSSRRKTVVRTLMDQISRFVADEGYVYYEKLSSAMAGAEFAGIEAYSATVAQRVIEKEGAADLQEAVLSKREKEGTLVWNGKEVKATEYGEIRLDFMWADEVPIEQRASEDRFNEVLGEEKKLLDREKRDAISALGGELLGEARKKKLLSLHLFSEQERLDSRRKALRDIQKNRTTSDYTEGMARIFQTAEEKEALREWFFKEKKNGELDIRKGIFRDEALNREVQFNKILFEVQSAPIDDFLDKDDGEFASSFAKKYEKLCKYASAGIFLEKAKELAGGARLAADRDCFVNESEFNAKLRFFETMKEQYEDRMALMSSPYYVSEKHEDMAKYLGADAENEKAKVRDQKLLEYITLYQKVYQGPLAIGKTKETKEHYDSILKTSREEQQKKDEEKVEAVLRRIKEGEEAKASYERENVLDEAVIPEEDAKAKKLLDIYNQQKARALLSFPEDDAIFAKELSISTSGERIEGMTSEELESMERIIMDDIYAAGRIGGVEIEPRVLSEVKELVRDFIAVRRDYLAESAAGDFVSLIAKGMDLDLSNPLFKKSKAYSDMEGYIREDEMPEGLSDRNRQKAGEYAQKMSLVFDKLIGAGYKVFPEHQDRIEREAEGFFLSEGQEHPEKMSSFTVNGRVYSIANGLAKEQLKTAAGKNFSIEGKEGEELARLLDEHQKLHERIFFVKRNYRDFGGEKSLINAAYEKEMQPRLERLQDKIARTLGLMEKPIPDAMTALLDEVSSLEDGGDETLLLIKGKVEELRNAYTISKSSEAMSELAFACLDYMEKTGKAKKKNSERRTAVKNLLDSISGFMAENDSIYFDAFSLDMTNVTKQSAVDYNSSIEQKIMEKEGTDDLREALSKKRKRDGLSDALVWNDKEVKATEFKEIKMYVTLRDTYSVEKRASVEQFNDVFGDEPKIFDLEKKTAIQAMAGGLSDEAKMKKRLSKHLFSEQEKLDSRRKEFRDTLEPRVKKANVEDMGRIFKTAEEKEALRAWVFVEMSPGVYGIRFALFDDAVGATKLARCADILQEVQKASMDDFIYTDDGEFVSSFAEKYDRLCQYASADVILKIAEEAAGKGQISNREDFSVAETRAKIRFFKEMKEHYEDRMALMSSPYYISEKAVDMAKYLGTNADGEKARVQDPKLLEYITLYQKVYSGPLAMGKALEAKGYYSSILKDFRGEQRDKDEELVKSTLERIKAGEDAEKIYNKDHLPDGLVIREKDEQAKIQLKLHDQQKALAFLNFPKDDAKFIEKFPPTAGGNLIDGMNDDELIAIEKFIVEDIYVTGKAGGVDIDPATLSEVRKAIRDLISVHRDLIAEVEANDFISSISEGMEMDLANPLFNKSKSAKAMQKYLRDDGLSEDLLGNVDAIKDTFKDKMTIIFGKLISSGYSVFPRYQDRIDRDSAKYLSDKRQEQPETMSSFTVNGKEYSIVDSYEYTDGLLKKAAGLNLTVTGEKGEDLIRLLDEQQKLLERTYYVGETYNGGVYGEKGFIREAYMNDIKPQLRRLQEKIAATLGLMEEPLPDTMISLLDEVISWEKVSADTSVPVKTAAEALRSAKTKGEAATAMSALALACTNYIEKNGGNMLKSSSRKKAVKGILEAISGFMAENDCLYYDAFASDMAHVADQTTVDFNSSLEQRIMEREGMDDFRFALSKKRQLEMDKDRIADSVYAPGRVAFKNREKYRMDNKLDEMIIYKKLHGLSLPNDDDREEEYENLKETTPQLTEEGYRIYERFHNAAAFILHPDYIAIYNRAKANFKNTKGGDYSRDALALLRQVNFDKNNKPISDNDRKNHEFNLRVLRTYEKDDTQEREKIIAEELPHFLDHVELPTIFTKEDLLAIKNESDAATKANLKAVFKARLDQWIEDYLVNGDAAATMEMLVKSANQDTLKEQHPGVKAFREANPGFDAKMKTFDSVQNYIGSYSRKQYRISIGASVSTAETAGKSAGMLQSLDEADDMRMDLIIDAIIDSMLTWYDHANDPVVPYKTE